MGYSQLHCFLPRFFCAFPSGAEARSAPSGAHSNLSFRPAGQFTTNDVKSPMPYENTFSYKRFPPSSISSSSSSSYSTYSNNTYSPNSHQSGMVPSRQKQSSGTLYTGGGKSSVPSIDDMLAEAQRENQNDGDPQFTDWMTTRQQPSSPSGFTDTVTINIGDDMDVGGRSGPMPSPNEVSTVFWIITKNEEAQCNYSI